MSLIRVKTRRISNLYVLIGPPNRRCGALLRALARRVERRGDVIEHVLEVFTRRVREVSRANVIRMPVGDHSIVAEFLRYHVLVRVFGGDADAWLAQLRARGGEDGDLRFVHRIRARLRKDPALLADIRRMVDATPFWRAAEA